MEAIDLRALKHARDAIAKGWTQGASARDVGGSIVGPHSKEAAAFCAMGALTHSLLTCRDEAGRAGDVFVVMAALRRHLPAYWRPARPLGDDDAERIIAFNDAGDRVQADVLDLFDRTIADEEASDAV